MSPTRNDNTKIQKYKKYRNQTEIKKFSNPMGLQFLFYTQLNPKTLHWIPV